MNYQTLGPEEILIFMNFCKELRRRQFKHLTKCFTRVFGKRWRRRSWRDIRNPFCKLHHLLCYCDSHSECTTKLRRKPSAEKSSGGQWSKAFSKPRHTRSITAAHGLTTHMVVGSKPQDVQASRNSTLFTNKDWEKFSHIDAAHIGDPNVDHLSASLNSSVAKVQKGRRRRRRPRNRKRKPKKASLRRRSRSHYNSSQNIDSGSYSGIVTNGGTDEYISGLDIDTMSSVSPAERLNIRDLLHQFLEDQVQNASLNSPKLQ